LFALKFADFLQPLLVAVSTVWHFIKGLESEVGRLFAWQKKSPKVGQAPVNATSTEHILVATTLVLFVMWNMI